MKVVLKCHFSISYNFREIWRQIELRPGRIIVLNDLASLKTVLKMFFSFFRYFFKGFKAVRLSSRWPIYGSPYRLLDCQDPAIAKAVDANLYNLGDAGGVCYISYSGGSHCQTLKKSSLPVSIISKICIRIKNSIEIVMSLISLRNTLLVGFYDHLKFAKNEPRTGILSLFRP